MIKPSGLIKKPTGQILTAYYKKAKLLK